MTLKTTALITAGLVILLGRGFYKEVERNTEEKMSVRIEPEVDADSVSDVGFIPVVAAASFFLWRRRRVTRSSPV